MTENMKKLLEIVSASKELSAKVSGMDNEDIIVLAKELGVALTEADFVKTCELSDDELDAVVGGYGVGDTVTCSRDVIDYCPNCGRLLKNYSATITGVRGVLDGHTLYWVTRNCCGYKTSIIDTEIHA